MGRRTFAVLPLALLFHIAGLAHADDFDCKLTVGKRNYDLSELYGEHVLTKTHFDTPSTFSETLKFDICEDLEVKPSTELPEYDQCPKGTRVCLVESNQKGNDAERILRVIPIAADANLAPQYLTLSAPYEGLNLILHGPVYPPDNNGQDPWNPQPQSFNLSIICPPDNGDSEAPIFQAYTYGRVDVEWRHRVVCEKSVPSPGSGLGSGSGETTSRGSGLGYFFLVLFLGLCAYFAIGAYYNYNNYGASGWDLIPHRDFWRDVPYLFRDVFSHLCSSIRPRGGGLSGRGGYVQV